MGLNFNWMEDEEYTDSFDNKSIAEKKLQEIKERQAKEIAHWEERTIRGQMVKVRVIDAR